MTENSTYVYPMVKRKFQSKTGSVKGHKSVLSLNIIKIKLSLSLEKKSLNI